MELILVIYLALFLTIFCIFKSFKNDNPFKSISFWLIQATCILLLISFIAFIILRAIAGHPGLREATKIERIKLDSLAKNYGCEIRIEKDWRVIVDNKSGGRLYIQLNFNTSKTNFCQKDSSSLLKEATQISQSFQSIMDKKEMYNEIAIYFYASDLSVKGAEIPTCTEIFVFSIPNNKFVEYAKLNNQPISVK